MHIRQRIGYFCAGILLTNRLPHVAIGLTGRRQSTPLTRDSSAGLNLMWAALNSVSGALLLRWTDRRAGGPRADSHAWLVAVVSGELCWSLFMVLVEASGFTHRPPAAKA
jgi:hypothetical protein